MRVGGDTHGGNAENKNVHTPGIWELEIVVRILDTGDLTMPLLLMETNEQSSALLQNRATQAQFVLCLGTYILYSRGRILK